MKTKALCMFLALAAVMSMTAGAASAKEKVILDSDMVELFDDGIAMLMLANHPNVDLLGVTVVTGNQWLQKGLANGVRQLELCGLDAVPVVAGARWPMRTGRFEAVASPAATGLEWSGYERKIFGVGVSSYAGAYSTWNASDAWGGKEPVSKTNTAPYQGAIEGWKDVYLETYGEAPKFELRKDARKAFENQYQHASDFIVEMVNKYPNEITIIAIGPCTNLQMAVMKDPGIVPKVKKVIYMGGAVNVAGNTSPAGEFNWWFDPEAARYAVRTPWGKSDPDEEKITQYVVPLDVCEKLHFTHARYDKLVNLPGLNAGIKALFEQKYGAEYADPASKESSYVWDAITAAVFIGELDNYDIVLPANERNTHHDNAGYMDWWIDVNADYNIDYGRSPGYAGQGPAGTQKVRIINTVDEEKFWNLVYKGLDSSYVIP